MNTIKTFTNENLGTVRTLTINGNPYFIGKDVAHALGYSNASKAVMAHVDDDDKQFAMLAVSDSQNGNLVKTAIINESGLYSLILTSKLPSAKAFKRWVTSEVLPAIRQNGGYIDGQEYVPAEEKSKLEAEIRELHRMAEDYKYQNRQLVAKVDYLAKIIEREADIDPDATEQDTLSEVDLYDLDVEGYDEFQSEMEMFNFSDYSLMEELKAIINDAKPNHIDKSAAKYLIDEIHRLFVERNAN